MNGTTVTLLAERATLSLTEQGGALLGYGAGELVGRDLRELLPDYLAPLHRGFVDRLPLVHRVGPVHSMARAKGGAMRDMLVEVASDDALHVKVTLSELPPQEVVVSASMSDGVISSCSANAGQVLGWDPIMVRGTNVLTLVRWPGKAPEAFPAFARCLVGGVAGSLITCGVHVTQAGTKLLVRLHPVYSNQMVAMLVQKERILSADPQLFWLTGIDQVVGQTVHRVTGFKVDELASCKKVVIGESSFSVVVRETSQPGCQGIMLRVIGESSWMDSIADKFQLDQEGSHKSSYGTLRARHKATGEPVAVCRDASEDGRRTFLKKVQVMSHIDNRNVLKLFDACLTPEDVLLVTELASGPTLEQELAAGPLPADVCLVQFVDAALAINALHAAKIAHLNVSPKAFQSDRGILKLIDFSKASFALTTVPSLPDNLFFASPEQRNQLTNGVDCRASDIWGLGALLVVMSSSIDSKSPGAAAHEPSKSQWRPDFPDMGRSLARELLRNDGSSRLTISAVITHPWIRYRVAGILSACGAHEAHVMRQVSQRLDISVGDVSRAIQQQTSFNDIATIYKLHTIAFYAQHTVPRKVMNSRASRERSREDVLRGSGDLAPARRSSDVTMKLLALSVADPRSELVSAVIEQQPNTSENVSGAEAARIKASKERKRSLLEGLTAVDLPALANLRKIYSAQVKGACCKEEDSIDSVFAEEGLHLMRFLNEDLIELLRIMRVGSRTTSVDESFGVEQRETSLYYFLEDSIALFAPLLSRPCQRIWIHMEQIVALGIRVDIVKLGKVLNCLIRAVLVEGAFRSLTEIRVSVEKPKTVRVSLINVEAGRQETDMSILGELTSYAKVLRRLATAHASELPHVNITESGVLVIENVNIVDLGSDGDAGSAIGFSGLPPAILEDLKGKRVTVVDPHLPSGKALVILLQAVGLTCQLCTSFQSALLIASKHRVDFTVTMEGIGPFRKHACVTLTADAVLAESSECHSYRPVKLNHLVNRLLNSLS